MNQEIQSLHRKALEIVSRYRSVESELLEILSRIEEKRAYLEFGVSSLFSYATQALGLTESVAYSFITVARKSRQCAELKKEIVSGTLSVSKAAKVASVMNAENQREWIVKAKVLPRLELEKEVAAVNPKAMVPERAHYVTSSRVRLELGVSEAVLEKLNRARDLVSQKKQTAASYEDTLLMMLDCFLEKHDPVAKASRAVKREGLKAAAVGIEERAEEKTDKTTQNALPGKSISQGQSRVFTPILRTPIPAAIKHQITLRDGGQCTHVNGFGQRCLQKRWIDIHHVTPVSLGGDHSLINLITVCSVHHDAIHRSI